MITHVLKDIHYPTPSRGGANYSPSALCSVGCTQLSGPALTPVPSLRLLPCHIPPVSYSGSDLHVSSKYRASKSGFPIPSLSSAFPSPTHLRREQGRKYLSPGSESYWYWGTQSRRRCMQYLATSQPHIQQGPTFWETCVRQNQGAEGKVVQRNSKQQLRALLILIIYLLFLIIYHYTESKELESTGLRKEFVMQPLEVLQVFIRGIHFFNIVFLFGCSF